MADKKYKVWLAGLKVGDRVVVDNGYGNTTRYSFTEVTKVTATGGLRIKGYTARLFKNGKVPSSEFDNSYSLLEPTDEITNEIILLRARRYLKNVEWSEVGDDRVLQVWEFLR